MHQDEHNDTEPCLVVVEFVYRQSKSCDVIHVAENWNFNWIFKLFSFHGTVVLIKSFCILVSVVSNAWEQWQQPADGAEV